MCIWWGSAFGFYLLVARYSVMKPSTEIPIFLAVEIPQTG